VSHAGPAQDAVPRGGRRAPDNGGMPEPGDVVLMQTGDHLRAERRIREAPAALRKQFRGRGALAG